MKLLLAAARRTVLPCAAAVALATIPASGLLAQQEPETWELSAEPLMEAGGPGAEADEFFTDIAGAVRLEDGRFVVADQGELRLSVYDPDGDLSQTIGSGGEGPGEFRYLSGIWTTGGDTIGVWDGRLNRLTWLRPDGEVVRTARPGAASGGGPVAGGNLDMFLGAFGDGSVALAALVTEFGRGERAGDRLYPDRMVFALFDASGRFQRLLGQGTGMVRSFVPEGGGGPIAFSPYPWAAVVRDSLVYTNGMRGRIHVYDPAAGDTGAVRRLAVEGSDLELDEARRALDRALEGASDRARRLASLSRSDVTAGQVPELGRMFADDEGRLWLKAYDPAKDALAVRPGRFATGGSWTIVASDGTVVARLDMPEDVAPLAVEDGLLLGLARDELDVERFVVYRIQR